MKPDNTPYGGGPRWRTPTVLQMIRAARADRKVGGVLPVLADALEEAGYPDADTLLALRAIPEMPPHRAAVLLARLEGGDAETSVDWLDEFAHAHLHGYEYGDDDDESVRRWKAAELIDESVRRWTAAELIKALDEATAEGEPHCLGFDTPDETWRQRDEILRHYAAVTGSTEAEKYEGSLFRCSC